MVKVLSFKGDKKPKKRKRERTDDNDEDARVLPTAAEAEDEENWVSAEAVTDISGPVMLVLASEPVTSLATDAMGKVHASPVENTVEDSPHTAEPHLVSQVWIATRVVGSERDFTFKGHHSRYFGCDKYGICSALREAISPEETFKVQLVDGESGVFDVQTGRSTYISVDGDKASPEARGDSEESSESTHV